MNDEELWEFMEEDDEIVISKENKLGYRFRATYYKFTHDKFRQSKDYLDITSGKGMTVKEALENLLKNLEK